ncbi:MAG: DUF288 domain-containing protein [Proteobacteria bacterium]|nr:DUF288 domain-containing protein [Pseudomonadota bacterium]
MSNTNYFAAVLTTINRPNDAMNKLLNFATTAGAPVIVVGDTKTPDTWAGLGYDFLSFEGQTKNSSDFGLALPAKHYARKNLGYLRARNLGVEWIYETDDDNFPIQSPFGIRNLSLEVDLFKTETKWLNVYEVFGYTSPSELPPIIWPRGFDLRSLKLNAIFSETRTLISPIQQGLANGDPDVDAIYRLVLGNFVNFNSRSAVALSDNQICPINSQTTWWHSSVYQLMYLPSTCTFRLTDILRGFVAWRILRERNETISFHAPVVRQDRNEHDLLRDFSDETELFLHSENLIADLLALNLQDQHLSDQLISCYRDKTRQLGC